MNENEEFEFRARAEKESKSGSPDYKKVIGSSVKGLFQKPISFAKDLGTNPESMSNVMPGLLGTLGGVSPIPGGATMGTGIGQGIRAGANKLMGKPVPGMMQHGLELGGSALGDIAAIPAIKGKIFGSQIGEAERLAGVPNIQKVPPPSQARTAVVMAQKVKEQLPTMTPMEARALKPAFDWVAKRGLLGNTEYAADFFQVKKQVDALVNQIPGRAAPAEAMGQAFTIPRKIGQISKAIPKPISRGVEYGVGQGIGGGAGWAVIKKLLGL